MKKLLTLVLASVLALGTLTACSSKDDSSAKGPEGTPAEIIEAVYKKQPVDLGLITSTVNLSDENEVNAYTGLASADKVKEASVSEAAIGSQAYSLVVVRVKDAKDTKAVAEEMKNGINPRKWICVEADNLRVVAAGDVVMLVMIESNLTDIPTVDDLADAFKNVAGGKLSVDLK